MYKCNECGAIFEEIATWYESRGEFWGMPCSEEMHGCPDCFSTDYDEIEEGDDE